MKEKLFYYWKKNRWLSLGIVTKNWSICLFLVYKCFVCNVKMPKLVSHDSNFQFVQIHCFFLLENPFKYSFSL